jgi:hypothetical protein
VRAGGVVALLVAAGCSGPNAAATTPVMPLDDGGAPVEAGRLEDASTLPTGSSGKVVIVDEPDTACTAPTGIERALYPADAAPAFDRLARVGARRVATSTRTGGFAVFDLDGANAAPLVVLAGSANVAASEGATIGMAGIEGTELRYARYDASGGKVGATLVLDNAMTGGLVVGGGAGEALVVWSGDGRMHARGVDASGALAGASFDFAAGSVVTSFVGSVVRGESSFAVAWSAPSESGTSRTFFMRASTTGPIGQALELTGLAPEHEVVQLAKTTTGFAALVQERSPSRVLVVLLDPSGRVAAPARRLLGSTYAFAVSARGAELGVVARRTTGETQLRILGAGGVPRAAWTCFEVVSDGALGAGIDAEGAGYAVVRRTAGGVEVLTHVDAP